MKRILLLIPLLVTFVVLLSSFGGDPNTDYPSGSPAGYTGSPADGNNCTACHGGTASNATGIITSNIPASGYVPGTSYTITATLTGSGNKGFEISPQNTAGTLLGSLTAGSNNHITGTKYVTQNGSVSGSPAVWSFTWTAPAAGTGNVTFYGAFAINTGTTKLSTLSVSEATVNPLAATATATPSTIVSGGTSQLNVVATGGTGSYTYSWTSVPAGFTSSLQNPVVSPTVTTVYTVHVVSGTQSVNSNATVTVIPTLTATATANPTSIIQGGSSQLNVTVAGGTGTYTYSWSSVPAGFSSSLQNPVVTPSVTTVYTVHVVSGTQSVNSNATVTVIPTLTATATANPTSIIQGGSSQLNVTVAGGTGTYTYSWSSVPAGFSSSLQNPVVTPSVTTVYTVHVVSGTQSVNSSATVTVIPTLAATATATPPSIIAGGSSQLNVTATGGTGSYTYSWTSVPAGFTSSLQNPVVSPAATTVYTVQVTSGSQSASSSATVTVGPVLTATASANPATIIQGATSQLNVVATGGTGSYTYSWTSVPVGFTSSLQNPVVTPSVTTVYTVHVVSGTQSVNSSATVTVIPTLAATATATPPSIIAGGSSQLNVAATGGTGSYTYSWTSVPAGFTSSLQNPVVSPAVTTVYTVQVTSGSQNVSSSATVTVGPVLTATASANPATIIQGATSQLNVVATGGTGSYTYSWTSVPAGFTSSLQNPVVSPAATTIYTVQVTSGSQSASSSATVTVIPTLTATATATPPSIIAGGSSQLNVTATGGTGSYTYSWTSVPAGFTSSLQNPVVSPAVTTVYTVQVTSGSQNVSSSATVTVGAVLSATASANPTTIIQGATSQLDVVATGGTGSYTYSWTSVPAGFTSSLQNPVVSPAVTTIYTVHVVSGSQSVNSSATVTVIPTLTAVATATPPSIVPGGNSQLNVTATGGTGSFTYSWTSVPAGFTSNLQNPVVSPAATTVYTVQVTSGTQSVSSSVTVSVGTPLSATTSATPSTIIQGGSSQLNVTATGGTGSYSYSWYSVPAGFTTNNQNPVVSPAFTTTYTAVVTSGSETVTSSVTVTVIPMLAITVTANPTTIAPGGSSQLNVQATGGTGTYEYSWTSSPSGFTSHIQNPVVSPTATTTYYVTVISGTQSKNGSVKVTVSAGGNLKVKAWAKPSHIRHGKKSHLYCKASGGSGNYSYSWTSQPSGFTSHLQNPIVKPRVTTKYFVVVTSGNKTGSASTKVYVDDDDDGDDSMESPQEIAATEGIDVIGNNDLMPKTDRLEKTDLTRVIVSPNPCPGQFRLMVEGEVTGMTAVTIIDFHGKIIRKEMIPADELQSRTFDISTCPKGVYVVMIQADNLLKTVKLIVE